MPSAMHERGREIDDALAVVLVAEFGESVRARLVAALLGAAVRAVFGAAVQRMLDGHAVADVRRDQVTVIDEAFELLEHGVGDFGVRGG